MVHGDVGVAEQAFEIGAVDGIDGDADAAGDADLAAADVYRIGQAFNHPPADQAGEVRVVDLAEQHDELVTAEAGDRIAAERADGEQVVLFAARHRIAAAQAGAQPPRNFAQHQIADLVAQRVVDLLEVVEVNEQQCEGALVAGGVGQGLVEDLAQQGPVRQAGDVVEVGEIAHPVLRPATVGDVLGDAGKPEQLAPVADLCIGFVVEHPLAAIGVDDAVVQAIALTQLHRLEERRGHPAAIARIDHGEEGAPVDPAVVLGQPEDVTDANGAAHGRVVRRPVPMSQASPPLGLRQQAFAF